MSNLKKPKKVRKNIDLSDECVKRLSKMAIDNNTDFKNFAQDILEKYCENAEVINYKKPQK